MKNSKCFHGLCLAAVWFSANSQASTITVSERLDLTAKTALTPTLVSGDIVILPGGNIDLRAGDITLPGTALIGGKIELQEPKAIETQGTILSAQVMPLPSEPIFWAVHWTSGITRIGDYFDVEVLAISPLATTSPDELILGFGFNAELSGTGSAQFLSRSVNPLFDDISTQDGVNLTGAGVAFPGLNRDDTGSWLSLAVLHFQALTAGDLNIAISSDLNDFNQGLIYLTQSPLAIQANTTLTITAVPLPSAFLLFTSVGLMMLTGRRKHSKCS